MAAAAMISSGHRAALTGMMGMTSGLVKATLEVTLVVRSAQSQVVDHIA